MKGGRGGTLIEKAEKRKKGCFVSSVMCRGFGERRVETFKGRRSSCEKVTDCKGKKRLKKKSKIVSHGKQKHLGGSTTTFSQVVKRYPLGVPDVAAEGG